MAKDLFERYLWILEIIQRYGRVTRQEFDARWVRSKFGDRGPLPRRTFYNYRQAIADLFKVEIMYDPTTFEYYIEDESRHHEAVTNWLLNASAVNDVLSDSREIAGRVFLEDVPSAREYLHVVMDAVKENHPVKFDYAPYTRVNPKRGVVVEPYFLKLFKQRWYLTGRNVDDNAIKTYALDRMLGVKLLSEKFEMPEDFDAESFVADSFGIIFNQGEVKRVTLKVESRQAKYLRALPLHPSQEEFMHDSFSLFHYRLRLTPDFVQELLSKGPQVTVVEPPELKAMVVSQLKEALANYESDNK
ncbi:MAG: WYL domain-containing protein [Muribaculaceae bacterium]|nr:WYL domain-containing protein [Muribaculaceae bacterium]